MKRFKFYDLFHELPNGSLTPKREIIINGISFGPGVLFTRGVSFGGVSINIRDLTSQVRKIMGQL